MDTTERTPAANPPGDTTVHPRDTSPRGTRRGTTRASRRALPTALVLDGQPQWRDWVRSLARREGITLAELVASSLAERARRVGFDPPPDRL